MALGVSPSYTLFLRSLVETVLNPACRSALEGFFTAQRPTAEVLVTARSFNCHRRQSLVGNGRTRLSTIFRSTAANRGTSFRAVDGSGAVVATASNVVDFFKSAGQCPSGGAPVQG